jgi:hypothetical protein
MHLDRAQILHPTCLTWKWAKTYAKVIHILRIAYMWKGETSGATKSQKSPKIHVTDAGTRGDRCWPWHLSACPSCGSQRERDRRADAWAIDALRQRLSPRVSRTGERASDRRSGASVGRSPDASVGLKTIMGHFWTASVTATNAEGKTDGRVRRW